MIDVKETMRKLGELIRFHRRKAGLTQIQLADLAGIGKATVFDIEKGKTTVQMKNVLSVLAALNIDIHFEGPLMEQYKKSSVKAGG